MMSNKNTHTTGSKSEDANASFQNMLKISGMKSFTAKVKASPQGIIIGNLTPLFAYKG